MSVGGWGVSGLPILNGFSKKIAGHVTELKTQKKGVKQYIKELQDLDRMVYGQLQKIYKAISLIDAFICDTELTKASVNKPPQRDAVLAVGVLEITRLLFLWHLANRATRAFR